MQRCYFHPRIEAIGQCLSCKLTICFHCLEDDRCPECCKLKRFVNRGHTGAARPRLVEPPAPRRSVTMELMIERLQRQVLGDDAHAKRPPKGYVDTEAPARAKRQRLRRAAPIRSRRPMAYGFLMPSVAPLVRVSRSPISRVAVLMVMAFSLGIFFARQGSVSAVVPSAETPILHEFERDLRDEAPAQPNVEVQYKPVYIHVPVRQDQALPSTPRAGMPAPTRPAVAPPRSVAPEPVAPPIPKREVVLSQAMSYPIASRQKFAAVEEAPPAPQPSAPAKLDLAFPHAGNILRATPVIRVRVENPDRLALVNLAVDGQPIKAVPQISELIELPFDSTAFANGDHTLQILAMEQDGRVISSQAIPITIYN